MQDPWVARVNGRPIMRRDLEILLASVRERYGASGRKITADVERTIQQEVLKQMVDRELLFQEAQNRQLQSDEARIEVELDALASEVGGRSALERLLIGRGMSLSEVLSGLRRDFLIDTLVDLELGSQLSVPESDALQYYNAHLDVFQLQESRTVSQIWLSMPSRPVATALEAAHKQLLAIRARIEAGEPFDRVGQHSSEKDDRIRAGNLGVLQRGRLKPPLDEAVFQAPPGQVSPVVEGPTGLHLFWVTAVQVARTVDFLEAASQIREHLLRERRNDLIEVFVSKLREGAQLEYP